MTLAARATAPQVAEVLRARARRLAVKSTAATAAVGGLEAALIRVGDEHMGLPVKLLREIIELPAITPLPGLPPHLLGICEVRGLLVCVVDLAKWFGLGDGGRPRYLAIVQGPEGPLGLAAQDAEGFRTFDEATLEQPSAQRSGAGPARPVLGLSPDLITVLDVERLLGHPDLRVA